MKKLLSIDTRIRIDIKMKRISIAKITNRHEISSRETIHNESGQ